MTLELFFRWVFFTIGVVGLPYSVAHGWKLASIFCAVSIVLSVAGFLLLPINRKEGAK